MYSVAKKVILSMLCSKPLVAHVPHPNNLVSYPLNLAYCSDLVAHM